MIKRYLHDQVKKDLKKKMVFISGPRQVGKTTLAKSLIWVHYRRDVFGEQMELRYFRDTDKREVDFCITENRRPQMFIECKWKDDSTSPHLNYLQKKFPEAAYYQISATGKKSFVNKQNIIHTPAERFLQQFV